MPMIDLINNDGSIKNQFIKEASTGSDYSNSYTPEEISKIQAVSNMNDLRTGSALGSTFSNLRTKENDYNQNLIQIRNKGIDALMDIPASKRAKAYPKLVSMLKNQGADIGLPTEYDEDTLKLMNGRDQDWLSKMALQHQYRLAEIAARDKGEDEFTKVMKREQAKDIVEAQKNTAESESAYQKFLGNKENINDLVKRAQPGIGEGIGTIARKIFDPKSDVLTARASLNSELRSNILTAAKALKGNLSDKDIKFLEEQAGDLSMTNDQLLAVYNTLENRMKIAKESSSEVLGSLKSNAGLPGNRQTTTNSTSEKTDYKSKYGLK